MHPIVEFLDDIYPLSDACKLRISGILKKKYVSKRAYLLRSGETCDSIAFVAEGLLRCYRVRDEKELTVWLRREGSVVVSMESYYDGVSSREFIQAVEDSELFFISKDEEESLYEEFPEFNGVGRLLTRRELRWHADELWNIRTMTGMQRYQHLLEQDPELVRRVPLAYLASYLRLEPESLSRIRRQLSK